MDTISEKKYDQRKYIALASLVVFVVLILAALGGAIAQKTGALPFAALLTGISLAPETLTLEAQPPTVPSDEHTVFTWDHANKTKEGFYEMRYPCNPEVRLHKISGEAIPCDAEFKIETARSLAVIPASNASSSVAILVSISFVEKESENKRVTGSTVLSILPKKTEPAPTTTPPKVETPLPSPATQTPTTMIKPGIPSTTYYPSVPGAVGPAPINPNGVPDLYIQILATGIVSTTTVSTAESFTPKSSILQGQRPAIQFSVKNIGTNESGEWNFNAQIPTSLEGGDFTSAPQQSLRPGDFVIFTIAFDVLRNTGENRARFLVDPSVRITKDPNRQNNEATAVITRGY